jgi:lysophospholipase L1-like esterase
LGITTAKVIKSEKKGYLWGENSTIMKKILTLTLLAAITALAAPTRATAQDNTDWANYGRYAEANAQLADAGTRPTVVFMGNSITDAWAKVRPEFFAAGGYVGRGISGQVTAQMLARFQADVIALRPRAVVILAGTNDIAQNQGFVAVENIAANIISMAQLARANRIQPVICSILPAAFYPWRREIADVPAKVKAVNAILKEWAAANRCVYVDYFAEMADEHDGLTEEMASDGIHPTPAGYARMEQIVSPVLEKLLKDLNDRKARSPRARR